MLNNRTLCLLLILINFPIFRDVSVSADNICDTHTDYVPC